MQDEKVIDTETSKENFIPNLEIEGLSEESIKTTQKILERFLHKYEENPDRNPSEWLFEQLREEFPEKKEKELFAITNEILVSIEEYQTDLENLNQSCRNGISKESWFAEKLQDSAKGIAINQFGDYLSSIEETMIQSNKQMIKTILRADGNVNQNISLDGFIAEQYHVNQFNAKAVLAKSPFRAKVCVPPDGIYQKDSVDISIDNVETGQDGILNYQVKYGQNAKTTIYLLKRGNYQNQTPVVPAEQLQDVQVAFPEEVVTDHIGGTKEVPIQSDPLSKEQAKQLQKLAQDYEIAPKTDWNSYQTKELALNIGRQAGHAGIQAALLGMGIQLVRNSFSGTSTDKDELVISALKTGTDTGVKAAASGALKVASEKGVISLFPPGTPVNTIAKIACVGIEDLKILWRVTTGDYTVSEAMEYMGRTSVSMYAGLSAGAIGTGIGTALLGFIPLIGPLVGGIIGGIVGYTAGSHFGEKLFEGAKKIGSSGVKVVKQLATGVRNTVSKLWNKFTRIFN